MLWYNDSNLDQEVRYSLHAHVEMTDQLILEMCMFVRTSLSCRCDPVRPLGQNLSISVLCSNEILLHQLNMEEVSANPDPPGQMPRLIWVSFVFEYGKDPFSVIWF